MCQTCFEVHLSFLFVLVFMERATEVGPGDLEMDNFRRDMIKLAHIFNRLIMHLKNLVGDLRDANVLRRNISRPKSRNPSYISMAKKQRMKNFPNNINHLFRV